jgi:hypothetical protein
MPDHYVITKEDVEKHLSPQSRYRLEMMIEAINVGRAAEGKPPLGSEGVEASEEVLYSPWFDRGKR